jgi:hypothetical protein
MEYLAEHLGRGVPARRVLRPPWCAKLVGVGTAGHQAVEAGEIGDRAQRVLHRQQDARRTLYAEQASSRLDDCLDLA